MKSIIGVTADMELRRHFLNKAYVDAVAACGAVPLILPANGHVVEALDMIDGLLLSGGGDIHGDFFGQPLHEKAGDVHIQRDEAEIALAWEAWERSVPIFGICRGLQVLNVALGGDIIQHIEGHKQKEPRHVATHMVRAAGRLAETVGWREFMVNSIHHQVVGRVAAGLEVCGTAEDGYIEALCAPERPFVVGVQWHPEELMVHEPHRRLLEAFVDACKRKNGMP